MRNRQKKIAVMMSGILLVLSLVTGVSTEPAHATESITNTTAGKLQNGSFEEGQTWTKEYNTQSQGAIPSWYTTASDQMIELFRKNDGTYIKGVTLKPTAGNYAAELNANEESTLYQNVTTTPYSIYQWGLDHGARNGTDTMALVIGPSQAVAPSKPNDAAGNPDKTGRDQLMQMVDWLIEQGKTTVKTSAGIGEHLIIYSKKFAENGTFADNAGNNAFSFIPSSVYTEEWHIWIMASSKATSGDNPWNSYGSNAEGTAGNGSGSDNTLDTSKYYLYTVPDGQTSTLFGFVSVGYVNSSAGSGNAKTYGNFLDNINFQIYYPLSGSTTLHGSGVVGESNGTVGSDGTLSTGHPVTVDQDLITYAADGEALKVQAVIKKKDVEEGCEFVGLYYTIQDADGKLVTTFLQRDVWSEKANDAGDIIYTYSLNRVTSAINLHYVFIKSPTVTYDPNGGKPYEVVRIYNNSEAANVYSFKPAVDTEAEEGTPLTFISPYVSKAAEGQNDGWNFMGWLLTGDTVSSGDIPEGTHQKNADKLGTLLLPAEHTIACDYSGEVTKKEQYFKIWEGNVATTQNTVSSGNAVTGVEWTANDSAEIKYANIHKGLTLVAQWRWRQAFIPQLGNGNTYTESEQGGSVQITSVSGSDANYNDTYTVAGGKSYNAETNEIVKVTATANTGYRFVGWYDNAGNLISTNNNYSYTETKESVNTYYARFAADVTQTYIRQIENGNTWTETTDDQIATLDHYSCTDAVGNPISATATAQTGYVFVGWFDQNGNRVEDTMLSNGGRTLSYTITENATYYARFKAHTHNWTYQASGNIVYAWCTGTTECDYYGTESSHENARKLTLTAQSVTYSGNAYSNAAAKVINNITAVTGADAGTVTYYAADGNGNATGIAIPAPTDAGKYVATITIGGQTAISAFEIYKAAQTATVSMADYTYGSTVSTPTISGEKETPNVTYYYHTTNSNSGGTEWSSITGTTLEAGTYYMYAVLEETANYKGFTTPAKEFKVHPRTAELSWGGTEFTYNGSSQVPAAIVSNLVTGDNCTVTVTGAQTDANTGGSTYTATATGLSNSNYKLPDTGTTTSFIIKNASQTAPSLTPVNETIKDKADGSVNGLTTEMEYRKEGESVYTPVTDAGMTFASGTYYVRYKAKTNYNASPETTAVIGEGRKLRVTVPTEQTGYTLTVTADELDWHGSVTLTYTLKEGYSEKDNFAIKVNGTAFTTGTNGTYTYMISNVEADQFITVEGVADITAPAGEIAIADNRWNSLLNRLTFGLFFKETKEVEITATDSGSGLQSISYYVSETELNTDTLQAVTAWQPYTAKFNINPNHTYSVYAKLTDKAGNTAYLSSDGIVLYTDSQQETAAISFTKASGVDKTATVKLNGNTIKAISDGNRILTKDTDYTLSGNEITFKNSYLQSLAASETPYTLTVSYYPLGKEYQANADENGVDRNQAPSETTIELTVTKKELTDDMVWVSAKPDGTGVKVILKDNISGEEKVLVKETDYTIAVTEENGVYTVVITGKNNYQGSVTKNVDNPTWNGRIATTVVIDSSAEEVNPSLEAVKETNARDTLLNIMKDSQLRTGVESGTGVDYNALLYMKIKDAKDIVTIEEKQLVAKTIEEVKEIPSDATVGMYLDLSLFMTYTVSNGVIQESGTERITDTSSEALGEGKGYKQVVTIVVPESLRPVKENIHRTYYIIRVHYNNRHEAKADKLDVVQNGYSLTFETDKFSTYAIAYSDKNITVSVAGDDQDQEQDRDQNREATKTTEENQKANAQAVKTGDDSKMILWVIILLAAALSLAGIVTVRRKKNSNKR